MPRTLVLSDEECKLLVGAILTEYFERCDGSPSYSKWLVTARKLYSELGEDATILRED